MEFTKLKNSSIYKILEFPLIYDTVESMFGAQAVNKRFVEEYVQPQQRARVLDIGCGTARIIEQLPADVDYCGFDINPRNIAAAKRNYADRGEFSCSKVTTSVDLPLPGEYDLVLATHVLHHLNDQEAKELFSIAYSCLGFGKKLVTIDPVLVPNQPFIARLLIGLDRGKYVRTSEQYRELVSPNFSRVETCVVSDMFRYPYNHHIIRAVK